jgi:hypothetical protein
MTRVIGISGVARVGKDTFFRALLKESPNYNLVRVAFADELKEECNEFLMKNVGISAFTQDPDEKALIRPFLVTYGSQLRRRRDPSCWIKRAEAKVSNIKGISKTTVVITDVRYPNELDWIHSKMKGISIHLSREGIDPINEEEALYDPQLKEMCTMRLDLPNFPQETFERQCGEYVSSLYDEDLIPIQ